MCGFATILKEECTKKFDGGVVIESELRRRAELLWAVDFHERQGESKKRPHINVEICIRARAQLKKG